MRIGVIGLGKVGLPLALVMAAHGGHQVLGWDTDRAGAQDRMDRFGDTQLHPERELRELLAPEGRALTVPIVPDLRTLVENTDLFFIIVPTPHPDGYDGTNPLGHMLPPADYDYTVLQAAVDALMGELIRRGATKTVVIVSTVSPGTCRELFLGAPGHVAWAYSPVFISLGQVVSDLLDPDYLLVGVDDGARGDEAYRQLTAAWTPVLNHRPLIRTTVASAELGKMAVNAYLTTKITFMNAIATIADAVGADVDDVWDLVDGTAAAHSVPRAGLGEGGACRPRDLVTLEAISAGGGFQGTGMFGSLIVDRLLHTAWLAQRVADAADSYQDLPLVLVGEAYKPGVPYTDGSPAVLLANMLRDGELTFTVWDPETGNTEPPIVPAIYVLLVAHEQVLRWAVPDGSVVLDPIGVVHADNPEWRGFVRPGRQNPRPGVFDA